MSTRVQSLDVPISGPVVEIEPLSEAQQLAIARAYRGEAGEGLRDLYTKFLHQSEPARRGA
jgi:hypothetical protein